MTAKAGAGRLRAGVFRGLERSALPLSAVLLALFTLPPLALAARWLRFGAPALDALSARSILQSTALSLGTTSIALLVILVFGTALAYAFSRLRFPFKRALTVFVELPIVMPPAVAGLALLAAFGRQGLVGETLAQMGIRLAFTPAAVIIAQVFVASPYYIRAAQSRFSAIPKELLEVAGIDGAGALRTFLWVTFPLSRRALLSALTLAWSRALGEFGATIIFAGSLAGKTQTMTLLVYSALERDLGATFTVAILLLGMAGAALGAVRYLARLDQNDDPLAVR